MGHSFHSKLANCEQLPGAQRARLQWRWRESERERDRCVYIYMYAYIYIICIYYKFKYIYIHKHTHTYIYIYISYIGTGDQRLHKWGGHHHCPQPAEVTLHPLRLGEWIWGWMSLEHLLKAFQLHRLIFVKKTSGMQQERDMLRRVFPSSNLPNCWSGC